MTRLLDPFFVDGIGTLFDDIERIHQKGSQPKRVTYPPYNVSKTDNQYLIEMAVAGFSKDDIGIELVKNTLEVTGNPGNPLEDEVNSVQWIHRGIAKRGFNHKFKIADNVEVKSADMKDGMLRILLEEFVPEAQKPKKIDILG